MKQVAEYYDFSAVVNSVDKPNIHIIQSSLADLFLSFQTVAFLM